MVSQFVKVSSSHTILESLASDTFESGKAIARLLAERFPEAAQLRIILVTARSHVARAGVVLRHFGAEPITAPVAPKPTDHRLAKSRVFDFIRSTRGLKGVRGLARIYRNYLVSVNRTGLVTRSVNGL